VKPKRHQIMKIPIFKKNMYACNIYIRMASLFEWLKNCFNYYILGNVADELIAKISDQKNEIPDTVKHDLIASIMDNKPMQLIEQINDAHNSISDAVKDDLMSSILMGTHTLSPYTSTGPMYEEPEPTCINIPSLPVLLPPTPPPTPLTPPPVQPLTPPLSLVDDEDDTPLTGHMTMRQVCQQTIYVSKIIPSDQFVARPSLIKSNYRIPPKTTIDWSQSPKCLDEQKKIRRFIESRRQQILSLSEQTERKQPTWSKSEQRNIKHYIKTCCQQKTRSTKPRHNKVLIFERKLKQC
jgi:hypothetical protein